jgi:MerR family copper efflux transcriptional regulator
LNWRCKFGGITDGRLGIGQLAKRGGVGIDTVRYYERNGLLTPRTRLASSAQRGVGRVKRSAQAKLVNVQARIAALERVREGLAKLIAACPGHGRAADCPILRALTDEEVT